MRSGIELRNDRQEPIRDRECWLEVIKAPIVNEANQTIGITCISRDISTAKLLEAERVRRDVRLRESLVKDVNHRIKNTLQGVLPIIGQLALARPENADVVDAVIARVSAIADVHGLYGTFGESGHFLEQILLTLVSSLKVLHADFPLSLPCHRDNDWALLLRACCMGTLVSGCSTCVEHGSLSVGHLENLRKLQATGRSNRVLFQELPP